MAVYLFPGAYNDKRVMRLCASADGCTCHDAVTTVYRQLKKLGTAELIAFDTATMVFRIRHPNASLDYAGDRVAAWLDTED